MSDRQHRTRECIALITSINVHLWLAMGLLSTWPARPRPPVTEPIPIQLVRMTMPAPLNGEPFQIGLPETGPIRVVQPVTGSTAYRSNEQRRTRSATGRSQHRGPRVEYRVRIVDPQSLLVRTCDNRPGDPSWEAPASEQLVKTGSDPGRLPATAPIDPNGGGDRRPVLKIIQARIDAITPLVHRTAPACPYEACVVQVRFRINRRGYPVAHQIQNRSHDTCLAQQVDTVLHLAEPYPYLAGWIPVRVNFTL